MVKQKKSDKEIFFPEGKEIEVAGKKFRIKPFVLKNRIKVLNILAHVLKSTAMKPVGQKLSHGDVVVVLINTAGEKLIDIYELVLGAEKDWMNDNIQLKDEMTIIEAIAEVNDIPFLVERAKALAKAQIA